MLKRERQPSDPVPSRVLMTADTVGGVFSYAVDLARGLSAAGVRVLMATMGAPAHSEQLSVLRSIPNLELCEKTFAL